ncbi:39S ribosomal protein L53, mitochondrial isoform X1 [Talpa occidentalis]|uniref:39S ribosomal protein L53, mitochondrial isoform X1 n=1 Tax=Talpa occidentalis TaxID=50954 RepID=UPI00188F43B8|nr:39S ribosomal protein L53, mitochondrial isoform X1 [Talpa occidentalis]
MAAALARLGLRSVKQVRVQFCPFEKNVESTRYERAAVGTGRSSPSARRGSSPLGRVLKPCSHHRTFLQAVSSEKVRSTNLNCAVIADVRHDGSEPCVDVLFGDGHRLIMRGAHLSAQEMFTAFASHIQSRGTAGSEDKPGAGNGR